MEQDFGIWSLLPAALAIGMALVTRQVILSLFLGVWSGAWLLAGGDLHAIWQGFLQVMDRFLVEALVPPDASTDHISIILFTLTVGGMIGIIRANGGIAGIIRWVSARIKTARGAQWASMFTGGSIFFDDYGSMLITGNTMRPLTDNRGVSREKLAYIVDTTAAPLASTAVLTTWIGFQVSLLDSAMKNLPTLNIPAYELMISSIPYSFYSLLSVAFIALLILTNRDIGPMLKAERHARKTHVPLAASPEDNATNPPQETRASNAVLPLIALIISVVGGLFLTGWPQDGQAASLMTIFGNADPFKSMLWASLISLSVAMVMSYARSSMTIGHIMTALEEGLVPMLGAVMILTFAWAIAGVNDALGTANYLVGQLEGNLAPQWLPVVIFLLASLIAFATGSSWGVMAILVPLAIPLSWGAITAAELGAEQAMPILYASVASVLTGAVWGDHCSPISDTTILSSVSSHCDHMQHVRTQLPYAVLVASVSILLGLIPVGFGAPWWLGLIGGIFLLTAALFALGRRVD